MAKQGEIVLIPIPFTDLSSQKRRPVVIVSNDAYNSARTDIVVVAMTSNPAAADYSLAITSVDLRKVRSIVHPEYAWTKSTHCPNPSSSSPSDKLTRQYLAKFAKR